MTMLRVPPISMENLLTTDPVRQPLRRLRMEQSMQNSRSSFQQSLRDATTQPESNRPNRTGNTERSQPTTDEAGRTRHSNDGSASTAEEPARDTESSAAEGVIPTADESADSAALNDSGTDPNAAMHVIPDSKPTVEPQAASAQVESEPARAVYLQGRSTPGALGMPNLLPFRAPFHQEVNLGERLLQPLPDVASGAFSARVVDQVQNSQMIQSAVIEQAIAHAVSDVAPGMPSGIDMAAANNVAPSTMATSASETSTIAPQPQRLDPSSAPLVVDHTMLRRGHEHHRPVPAAEAFHPEMHKSEHASKPVPAGAVIANEGHDGARNAAPAAAGRADQVNQDMRLEQMTGGRTVPNAASLNTGADTAMATQLGRTDSAHVLGETTRNAEGPEQQLRAVHDRPVTERIMRGLTTMLHQRGGSMMMRLDPPDLGQLRIQMTVTRGMVNAQFHAGSMQARQIIERNIGLLRSALEGQGLNVERLTVQVQPSQTGQQATQTGQEHNAQREADSDADAGDGRSRGRDQQTGHNGTSIETPVEEVPDTRSPSRARFIDMMQHAAEQVNEL